MIGDFQTYEGEDYVYIYGAIQMQELRVSGMEYLIDDETWKRAYEECKQFFLKRGTDRLVCGER